jgi:hypothetical protein
MLIVTNRPFMLNVNKLNVNMMSVVMLNVMAPLSNSHCQKQSLPVTAITNN